MIKYRDDYEDDFYRYPPKAEQLTIQREWLALPVIFAIFIFLIASLFNLSVIKFPYYQAQASQNSVARITLEAPRGVIEDRRGKPLAVNHLIYDCYFITSSDQESDEKALRLLGKFLELTPDKIEKLIESRRNESQSRSLESELWAVGRGESIAGSMIVKRDLNQVEVTALLERQLDFPQVYIEQGYRRSYPAGARAAQIVGYMGEIPQTELNKYLSIGYRMGDLVGRAGLEFQYDKILRGKNGERFVKVESRGQILGQAESIPAVVPEGGCIVVFQDQVEILKNGDKVNFSSRYSASMVKNVVEVVEVGIPVSQEAGGEPLKRLILRDTGSGGQYGDWYVFRNQGEVAVIDGQVVLRSPVKPPVSGTRIKTTLDIEIQRSIDEILGNRVGGIVVMNPRDGAIIAMVSEPSFDPNLFAPGGVDPSGWQAILDNPHKPLLNRPVQNAYVPGSTYKIVTALAAGEAGLLTPGRTWTCSGSLKVGNRVFRCWNRGGHGTLDFAGAMAHSCDVAFWLLGQELGHARIADMADSLGMGNVTHIDLPDERKGLIPDEEWKKARIKEKWYLGDTMNMAIGQGFVQCSVLQICRMTAVVANGGYLVTPHVNQLLTPASGTLERIPEPLSAMNQIQKGLRACVSYGTGKACNLEWIALAGKTGTADDPPRKEPHSWFTSYGPFESPLLVITVFLENGGHGDIKAAQLARKIWECPAIRAYLVEQGYSRASLGNAPG